MVKTIVWPLLRLVFFTSLAQGVLLWLETTRQISVRNWVADMIGVGETIVGQTPGWVGYMLAGTIGLILMVIWEIAKHKGWLPRLKNNKQVKGNNETRIILEVRLMTDDEKKEIHNITSNYQSGGITAHTVNVGQGQRKIDQAFATQLLTQLPKDKEIDIVAVMGDTEALTFAIEINAFLRANGIKTPNETNVSQAVFSGPVGPLVFDPSENKLIVGSNK